MEQPASNVERALLRQLENPSSPLVKRVMENNQILLHNYQVEIPRVCECGLMGCANTFDIILIPNQSLYPRFCEEHRTEHRRRVFMDRTLAQHPKAKLRSIRIVIV